MKWLKNIIGKYAYQYAVERQNQESIKDKKNFLIKESQIHSIQNGIHLGSLSNVAGGGITRSPNTNNISFQIYPATGGHVVEISFIDTDSHIVGSQYKALHIVPSDKDLGEALSKIITHEMLKK